MALGLTALAFVVGSAWDHDAIVAWKEDAGALPFFIPMALLTPAWSAAT